jgi:hypothetical protein
VHVLLAFTALLLQQAEPPQQRPGAPAGSYWQQDIHFTATARLDEPSGVLTGSGRLLYVNHSPDTLSTLAFHLYLNAFRPGSKWAARQTAEDGFSPYAALPDPYYAYERLARVSVGGTDLVARYPGAPDSTVAEVTLPARLAPGDSVSVDLEWTARLSVIPRRQGRYQRRYDFAEWYPEVAVYDRYGWEAHPLYPEGEFYGEYGTYDVTLDLLADQVCAATGVPVSGDPGWYRARATPQTPVTTQRDWYGDTVPTTPYTLHPTPRLSPPPGQVPGPRKLVRFYAEHVEHFAFSCNPDYVYEEGHYGPTVIHVLYLPQDSASWGRGIAVRRIERSLAWLDTLFGHYAWPQVSAVHRIEGGGTEFPMMVMLGGAGESLILHEVGHEYTYGMLGNNEWKEGWLDEGFTTFQTAWNFHDRGMGVPSQRTQMLILGFDLDGWSQPVVQPAELYRDYQTYARMIYTKGQLVYEMLRYVLGDETFRRALREYYARWRFRHVSSETLQRVCEEVSHRDLGWFFAEWLYGEPIVDYGLSKVRRRRTPDGWTTDIEIRRLGSGLMPVDIAVPVGDTTLIVRADGIERRETVEVRTAVRPGRVELDPARQTMDWNYLNNLEGAHLPFRRSVGVGRRENRFGWSSTTPARRDRLVVNWLPLAWYTDGGGLTLGLQARSNYMGRFELNQLQLTWPVGAVRGGDPSPRSRGRPDAFVSLRNPVAGRRPRFQNELAAWSLEGRTGGRLAASLDLTRHRGGPVTASSGTSLVLMTVTDAAYLDRRRWDDVNTVELTAWAAHTRLTRRGLRRAQLEVALGQAFSPVPIVSPFGFPSVVAGSGAALSSIPPYAVPGGRALRGATYARGLITSRYRALLGRVDLAAHATLAATLGGGAVPAQRRVFLAGADPYETFDNPFLRSRGALFAGDAHYQAPGGGSLRGFDPDVSATWLVAAGMEAGPRLLDRPAARLFSSVSLVAFGDAALLDPRALGRDAAADAGVGLRATHRLGPTRFVTRLDLPLFVTRGGYAVGSAAGDSQVKFRWVWSLEEAF